MPQRAIIVDVADAKKPDSDDELEGTLEDRQAEAERSPIFADALTSGSATVIDHLAIERTFPVREGSLGRFEPELDETELARRHGGGKYRVIARNSRGQPIKGLSKSIDLAGEPIFRSKSAEQEYRRQLGLPAIPDAPAAAAGLGVAELLALLAKQSDKGEAADSRRAEREEKQHQHALERIKAESDAREAARVAEDDRRQRAEQAREDARRKDEQEREDRRRKDDADREERRVKSEQEGRARDREFQLQMATLARGSGAGGGDPTKALLAGIQLASTLRGSGGGGGEGGGADDPVAALVQNLPQIIGQLKSTLSPPAPAAAAASDNTVTLEGPLAASARAAVDHFKAEGVDPAAGLQSLFAAGLKMKRAAAPANPPPSTGPVFGVRRGANGRPVQDVPATPATPAANGTESG